MGTSTNGQICYGISYPEGYEFPWGNDIDDWWLFTIKGFCHSFEIYDNQGRYLNGVRPPEDVVYAYYKEKSDFAKQHPLPVQLVNACSLDYPMYIISIPSTVRSCNRGFPSTFTPEELVVSDDDLQSLLGFCQDYGVPVPDQPKWYLSSYWG